MASNPQELLRFEVRPSFGGATTLRLLAPPPSDPASDYSLACEVVGFTDDHGSWNVSVPSGEASRLLADFQALPLATPSELAVGLDGTTYHLAFEDRGRTRHFDWWSTFPEEWDDLGPLLLHLVFLAGERAERHVDILDCQNHDYRPFRDQDER